MLLNLKAVGAIVASQSTRVHTPEAVSLFVMWDESTEYTRSPLGTRHCQVQNDTYICRAYEKGRFSPLFVLFSCCFVLWITVSCLRCLIMLTICRLIVSFTNTHTHTHTHTHIHTHTHTRTHIHTHTRGRTPTCVHTYTHTHTHARAHAYTHTHTHTRTHTRAHVHTHARTHTFMYYFII